jgi:hypothetical protein
MEERLRALGARLDDLMESARKTKNYAAKINIDEIKRQKDEVERKLKELRGPAREAWVEVREGLSAAWNDVSGALNKAKAKFKK